MSNYPDNMSDFNDNPSSPEYVPRKKKIDDWEDSYDDLNREEDVMREDDQSREKEIDR